MGKLKAWKALGSFAGISLLVLILMTSLYVGSAMAEDYTDSQIADAIYLAEGGKKAKIPYGILSVKVKDEAEARQVCLNTIRNQRKRHAAHDCGKDYLVCLRDRYAPLQAKNDPMGLNSNWLKNVKFFLERGAK